MLVHPNAISSWVAFNILVRRICASCISALLPQTRISTLMGLNILWNFSPMVGILPAYIFFYYVKKLKILHINIMSDSDALVFNIEIKIKSLESRKRKTTTQVEKLKIPELWGLIPSDWDNGGNYISVPAVQPRLYDCTRKYQNIFPGGRTRFMIYDGKYTYSFHVNAEKMKACAWWLTATRSQVFGDKDIIYDASSDPDGMSLVLKIIHLCDLENEKSSIRILLSVIAIAERMVIPSVLIHLSKILSNKLRAPEPILYASLMSCLLNLSRPGINIYPRDVDVTGMRSPADLMEHITNNALRHNMDFREMPAPLSNWINFKLSRILFKAIKKR
jgi:hypothetical protein